MSPVEGDWAQIVSDMIPFGIKPLNGERKAAYPAVGARLLFLLLPLGCTVYTPIRGVEASPGYDVRVRLSDRGALDLVSKIGPRAEQLDGTLKSMTDSTLAISVRRISRVGGVDDKYEGMDLTLAREDIETIEKSTTSIPRSLFTAGAVIASALLVARGAGDASGGKSGGPPPPTR